MKALVIGATGATGKDLTEQLLADPAFSEVHIFVRRPLTQTPAPTAAPTPSDEPAKLRVHVVDFDAIDTWEAQLQGDVLFSALGTTLRQAGGQKAQWKVDYTYQYEVAKVAHANGVETMALVSSIGASATSKVFYSRMKGQLEDDIKQLAFKHLSIMRPPSLIRKNTNRFGERVSVAFLKCINKLGLLRSLRPMPTSQVAHAMIAMTKQAQEGTFTLEAKDLWAIN